VPRVVQTKNVTIFLIVFFNEKYFLCKGKSKIYWKECNSYGQQKPNW